MNQSFEKAERIRACKNRRHVTLVTAYDYPTGRLLDEAGVDIVLVGDSLGMVVLGFPDTTHVTLDHMLHHVEATARGVKNALLVGDMPIHSYDTVEQAVQSAKKLFLAGADAVKLEGGAAQAGNIRAIVEAGIPVVGHIGLLPQKVLEEGGYKIKGKSSAEEEALVRDVEAVAEADTIVFDKTGTLTKACPTVAEVVPFNDESPDELLRLAACLEEHFPHSMAKAVVDAARARNLNHEEKHSKVEYIVAHGISTTVDRKSVV